MPSFTSFLSAVSLAGVAYANTIKITATSDNKFNPEIIKASDGDVLEFHYEPQNHSVVAGDYQYPCSPLQLGTGFFSGFFPSKDGEADKVFHVILNGTKPLPIYSSQGNECASGMVAIINPTDNVTLADYKKRASSLSRSVTPGVNSFGGELADNDGSGGSGDSKGSSGSSKDSGASLTASISLFGLASAIGLALCMA